jgi:NADP-reducing hydrogenase subunit HndB
MKRRKVREMKGMDNYEVLNSRAKEKQKAKSDSEGIVFQLSWCSTAVGAKEVLERINKVAKRLGISNIEVKSVGCKGLCSQEPTLEVKAPGHEPVLYSLVTADRVEEILMDYYSKLHQENTRNE